MNLLILSIGSNPLPNYITVAYLLNQERDDIKELPVPDNVMFVYSSDTEKFKDTIVKLLDKSTKYIEINLGTKHREFDHIKVTVKEELDRCKDICSIHLNYTGGTKPMAVGISSAVVKFKCTQTIYSDLSPESYKLTLRNGNEFPTSGNIRDNVKIDIENLYELHDLSAPGKKSKNSDCYSLEFVKFLIVKVDEYKSGTKDFYELWNKDYKSNNKESLLESVKTVLQHKNDLTNKDMKELQKFIRGDWLEEYLFTTLFKIKDECKITDLAWNIEANVNNRPFEIDVMVMKGCQSFVFTCTIAYGSPRCKGKAFEGVYRSEQIGGEHSKTILICLADDKGNSSDGSHETVKNIRKDMSQFDAFRNFYILGVDDIRDEKVFKENLINILGR